MMNASMTQSALKGRFDKLSLKKNRKKAAAEVKCKKSNSPIVLDGSFDSLKTSITNRRGDWRHISSSPIVINDSFEVQKEKYNNFSKDALFNVDHKDAEMEGRKFNLDLSITPKNVKLTVDMSDKSRPSPGGWSPAQHIMCGSPIFITTPSRPTDVANESQEECTIDDIMEAHKDILDDLYGDVWKSIPTLFKKKQLKKEENLDSIAKKLDFLDQQDSDKENLDIFDTRVHNFYASDTQECTTPKPNFQTDIRTKKKLYTEKSFETPNTDIKRLIRKEMKDLQIFTETKPPKKATTERKKIEKKTVQKKTDEKKTDEKKTVEKKKVQSAIVPPEAPLDVKKLSFMASLADMVPTWRCDPEALLFKQKFKSRREELTRRLFLVFNKMVFDDGLENDMPVLWDAKLRSTAGTATNRLVKTSGLVKLRTSSIKLSTKVVDGAQKLRDTLVHEMCHAATWVIDQELRAGHGPLWKKWARRALKVFPELEEISRCHDMVIHFKYTYKCTQCGYTVNRHSKSIDVAKKCCGYCRGTFDLIVNKKSSDGVVVSTPARRRAAGGFASYVQEHYAATKTPGATHAQVMKLLGQQYSARKQLPDTEG